MERFTISLDDQLAAEFDRLLTERGYTNRSEALRDLLRSEIEAHRQASDAQTHCVGSLSYVYNHHQRELAERLTTLQHDHHDLCVSTMHAHLDHDHCLETLLLRGPTAAVRRFADRLRAERGVRHGQLNLITVDVGSAPSHVHSPLTYAPARGDPHPRKHSHDDAPVIGHSHSSGGDASPPHTHLKPRT